MSLFDDNEDLFGWITVGGLALGAAVVGVAAAHEEKKKSKEEKSYLQPIQQQPNELDMQYKQALVTLAQQSKKRDEDFLNLKNQVDDLTNVVCNLTNHISQQSVQQPLPPYYYPQQQPVTSTMSAQPNDEELSKQIQQILSRLDKLEKDDNNS